MSSNREKKSKKKFEKMDETQLNDRFFQLFFAKDYEKAMPYAHKLAEAYPESPIHLGNFATCLLLSGDAEAALPHYRKAHALHPRDVNVLDGLTQVCGDLGMIEEARLYGHKVLALKDEIYSESMDQLPPLLDDEQSQPGALHVVSFSLYGDNPRYCETAVMNVEAAREILPGWLCRFYVDESVPSAVLNRIVYQGGQIVRVNDRDKKEIPALMWRFMALTDPLVRRVAFRDADSLISAREQQPVNDWLTSGKRFHVMRDFHTHSELILAGMWGATAAPLRDIRQRIQSYLLEAGQHPTHVDQHFLRSRIWPLIKNDLISHDRVFGFYNALPLPEPVPESDGRILTIGSDYGSRCLSAPVDLPDGSVIEWWVVDKKACKRLFTYYCIVQNKKFQSRIPLNIARGLDDGRYEVRINPVNNHPVH